MKMVKILKDALQILTLLSHTFLLQIFLLLLKILFFQIYYSTINSTSSTSYILRINFSSSYSFLLWTMHALIILLLVSTISDLDTNILDDKPYFSSACSHSLLQLFTILDYYFLYLLIFLHGTTLHRIRQMPQ